jgi:Rv2258c-like winged HTH domain
VRKWLSQMAAGGCLEYDPETSRFTLPAEHAPVLRRRPAHVPRRLLQSGVRASMRRSTDVQTIRALESGVNGGR